ncbi:MAG: hypothetical protein NT007_11765 [Candidatus Kapabacteria bacterium]|nr:hypothetical protein [Candidatus Kapabacteria bacterium]
MQNDSLMQNEKCKMEEIWMTADFLSLPSSCLVTDFSQRRGCSQAGAWEQVKEFGIINSFPQFCILHKISSLVILRKSPLPPLFKGGYNRIPLFAKEGLGEIFPLVPKQELGNK